jgi:hypothetical protein
VQPGPGPAWHSPSRLHDRGAGLHDVEVRFGLYLPPVGEFADPRRVADLAAAAEEAGWAGLFLWDHMLAEPGMAVADPWAVLAAVAGPGSCPGAGLRPTPA